MKINRYLSHFVACMCMAAVTSVAYCDDSQATTTEPGEELVSKSEAEKSAAIVRKLGSPRSFVLPKTEALDKYKIEQMKELPIKRAQRQRNQSSAYDSLLDSYAGNDISVYRIEKPKKENPLPKPKEDNTPWWAYIVGGLLGFLYIRKIFRIILGVFA